MGAPDGFADAYPHQLSGGMRRRVALLMSLAVRAAHPAHGRAVRRARHAHQDRTCTSELLEIWRELGQTIVMVTHDLDEAITLSTRVIVLSSPPSTVLLDERGRHSPSARRVFAAARASSSSAHYPERLEVLGQQFRAAA